MRDMTPRRGLLAASAAAALPANLLTLHEARAQGIAPKRGGTLNTILTPEPPILILGVNNQGPTLICGSKIYQSLLKFSPKLEPLPELAKSWELSDDKRTYTFHLQDNVKLHDGEPMTADDVVFSVMKFHMELAPRARGIFAKIKDASAPDPLTVEAHPRRAVRAVPADVRSDVGCAIVPKHVYDGTDYRNNPKNQTPIGTGPFKFAEWQRGNSSASHVSTATGSQDSPISTRSSIASFPTARAARWRCRPARCSSPRPTTSSRSTCRGFARCRTSRSTRNGWEYFSPLSWIEIEPSRQAARTTCGCARRSAMRSTATSSLNRLWFGIGKRATGPIASTTRFYDPASPNCRLTTRERQSQLLDAAGLKPDAQGRRASPSSHLVLPYGEVWTRLAEYFRTALHQVGIEVVARNHRRRRLGAADRRLGLRHQHQLLYPVRRSDARGGAHAMSPPTSRRYLHQHRRLCQPEGRRAVRHGARHRPIQRSVSRPSREVQKILSEEVPQIWMMEMALPRSTTRSCTTSSRLGTGVHACFDDVFLA